MILHYINVPELMKKIRNLGLPPFHFPNPGRRSGAEPPADGHPGLSPQEHFWNCIPDLVHFDAVWWQLFVGWQTLYICNIAIKIKPICQLQCSHDCMAVLPLPSNEYALKSRTFGVPGLNRAQIRDRWQP